MMGSIIAGCFIALIIVFVIQFLLAKMFAGIALDKGYRAEETHAFAKCFFLGIYGMIYVAALPPRAMSIDSFLSNSIIKIRHEDQEILKKLESLEKRINELQSPNNSAINK